MSRALRFSAVGGSMRAIVLICSLQVVATLLACQSPKAVPPALPPAVEVAQARATDSSRDLVVSGTLEAERSLPLSFAVPGTVEQVSVAEGESVSKDQVLARLWPRSFEDALGMARAKADQVEDVYRRLEPMYRNHTLPEVKWIEAMTGREEARRALSLAQRNLDDAVLRAPAAGIVARRHLEPGAVVAPGIPAVTLVQAQTVLAVAPVPETQVAGVRPGQAAVVTVPALGEQFAGTVREVGVIADPLTRTYRVRVIVPNPDGRLRLGMVATVRLHQTDTTPAVVVPPEAVRLDAAGRTCVYVVEPSERLARRIVQVSGYLGEGTALSSGVATGERVVVSGTPMLADGLSVRVVATAVTADGR